MKKRLIILGGGESGVSAALLGQAKGFDVFLSDSGTLASVFREELLRAEIDFEENGHFSPRLQEADLVVKSPGIPSENALVESYRKRDVPVISEIEFAARFAEGRIVAITGTNGKTTTTHLVDHLFREAGFSVGCGGNIGYGFARLVLQGPKDWFVLEVSSFQLDDIKAFRPDIAILLNVTPDHLDRYHNDMAAYADAKWRITANQGSADTVIYQADNAYIEAAMQRHPSACHRIPVGAPVGEAGAWLDVAGERYDLSAFVLQGDHNLFNTTCAILAARAAGISMDRIQAALPGFKSVRHRMEPIVTFEGVTWINDSKATNVDAVWYALKAMKQPVIWIAGGKDKGNDYQALEELVREKVKALVCLGLDTRKLEEFFAGKVSALVVTRSMEAAVQQAAALAQEGDVVLLSPACASFDLFKNYEHRGDLFRQAVLALPHPENQQP